MAVEVFLALIALKGTLLQVYNILILSFNPSYTYDDYRERVLKMSYT